MLQLKIIIIAVIPSNVFNNLSDNKWEFYCKRNAKLCLESDDRGISTGHISRIYQIKVNFSKYLAFLDVFELCYYCICLMGIPYYFIVLDVLLVSIFFLLSYYFPYAFQKLNFNYVTREINRQWPWSATQTLSQFSSSVSNMVYIYWQHITLGVMPSFYLEF